MTCCLAILTGIALVACPPLGLAILLGASMVFLYHLWTAAYPPPPRLTASQVTQVKADRNRAAVVLCATLGALWLASSLGLMP